MVELLSCFGFKILKKVNDMISCLIVFFSVSGFVFWAILMFAVIWSKKIHKEDDLY